MPKLVRSLELTRFAREAGRAVNSKENSVNREPLTINWRRSRPAFSLIEVLLAVFMTIILATILLTTASTLTTTHKSNLQYIATKIATKELENLRSTAYASLPTTGSFTDTDLAKLPSATTNRIMVSYQNSLDVKHATIIVDWQENGVIKQTTLTTLIYKDGI